MQVYLPDELYARVKAAGADINVSALVQAALQAELEQRARYAAQAAAVAAYEAEFGAFTEAELQALAKADRAAAVYPGPKKKRRKAA